MRHLPAELQSLVVHYLDLSSLVRCYEVYPTRATEKYLERFNPLEIVVARYPDAGPDLIKHSSHPIPDYLITKYETKWDEVWYDDKLRWDFISERALVTPELIERYLHKWNWKKLSSNIHLTSNIIEQFRDKWNWYELSRNRCMTCDLLSKYLDCLEWTCVSKNRNLTAEFVDQHHERFDYIDWMHVSQGCELNISIVDKYRHKWNWYWLSLNKSITPEIIEKYEHVWNRTSSEGEPHWAHLVLQPAFTPALIEKYRSHLTCKMLSKSPYLSVDLIELYPGNWDWEMISYESYCPITVDIIERYTDKWDEFKDNSRRTRWSTLGSARCLTPELIVKYEDKWTYNSYMSSNPCLTPEIIERYLDRWDWERMSYMCSNEKWKVILLHPE